MSIDVEIQFATTEGDLPDKQQINNWVCAALEDQTELVELTVRIVDEEEGRKLNQQWRQGTGATNVLSFPTEGLEEIQPELLGDVVICAPVVQDEAIEQKKSPESHWAHMVIHGTLHLLGYDHNNDKEAEHMESLEVTILERLGYKNPYT